MSRARWSWCGFETFVQPSELYNVDCGLLCFRTLPLYYHPCALEPSKEFIIQWLVLSRTRTKQLIRDDRQTCAPLSSRVSCVFPVHMRENMSQMSCFPADNGLTLGKKKCVKRAAPEHWHCDQGSTKTLLHWVSTADMSSPYQIMPETPFGSCVRYDVNNFERTSKAFQNHSNSPHIKQETYTKLPLTLQKKPRTHACLQLVSGRKTRKTFWSVLSVLQDTRERDVRSRAMQGHNRTKKRDSDRDTQEIDESM